MITVKELIDELQQVKNKDAIVIVYDSYASSHPGLQCVTIKTAAKEDDFDTTNKRWELGISLDYYLNGDGKKDGYSLEDVIEDGVDAVVLN